MKFKAWWHQIERDALLGVVRLIVGGKAIFEKAPPTQGIYFSNHTSHLDTLLILAALPKVMRSNVRPVAGADYWNASPLRRYLSRHVLNVVTVDRQAGGANALLPLQEALELGYSLILFPEGTRHDEVVPGEFKSGLYYLTQAHPELPLVPVYLENLQRVMPKGAPFPLPLLCRVNFGATCYNSGAETKAQFLMKAKQAVTALAKGPSHE